MPPTEVSTCRREPGSPSKAWEPKGFRGCLFLVALGFWFASSITGCESRTNTGNEEANVFHHDFRGKPLPPEFGFYQAGNDVAVADPHGLHLKSDRTRPWGSGIKTAFGVQGDFEVTLAFEMLQMVKSSAPTDIGLSLCLQPLLASRESSATAMDRFLRNEQMEGIRWYSRPTKLRKEKRTTERICRYQMTRVGQTVRFAWAPGTQGSDFEQLGEAVWPNEIEHVRVVVFGLDQDGGSLEARLLDFHIRADKLTNISIFAAEKGGLTKALLAGMAITLLIAVAAWLFFRRRRKPALSSAATRAELDSKTPSDGTRGDKSQNSA
jgi:hypothetical protein